MSLFWIVMIISWSGAAVVIGFCAANESGGLARLRKRVHAEAGASATLRPAEEPV